MRLRTRTTSVILAVLALSILPLAARAGVYQVDFGVTTGGPAPTGTITFADPEPSDGTVNCTDFSFSDGTSTWTFADDVLHTFYVGGFTAGELTFIAVKVEDTVTGRYLEIFSSGNPGDYQICSGVDGFDQCIDVNPQTTGPFTFAPIVVPGVSEWSIILLVTALLAFATFRIMTARRTRTA